MQKKKSHPARNILFLDGDCVFCTNSAQIVHSMDKAGAIQFAPLQGETAQQLPEGWKLLDKTNGGTPSAAVLAENFDREVLWWRGADAILRTLKLIGGIWSIFWYFHHLPDWLKDSTYNFIAKNRYRIAGKKQACQLPDSEFAQKMLP